MAHVNVERSAQQYSVVLCGILWYSVVQLEDSQGSSGNLARFFPFYWIQVNCGEAAATARAIHSAAFEETLLLLYASKQIPMICTF